MSEVLFSVLIPSVPRRISKLAALFEKLQAQAKDEPVEILSLLDNKKRSVGLKREALVQSAQGSYLAFVDDDDDVADDYISKIVGAVKEIKALPGASDVMWPDVIVFKQHCTFVNAKAISCLEIDGPPFTIHHSIHNAMQAVHQYPDGTWKDITRKPWHHNAWRSALAKKFHFPDKMFGEDGEWCEQMWPEIRFQYEIDGPPLHYYHWNGKTTEAS